MTEPTDTKPEPVMPQPVMPKPVMRRLMRSKALHVTSLMATASFSLAACGVPQASPPEEPSLAYTSLADCKAANDITDAECDAGFTNAQVEAAKNSPRYATQQECEGQWGPSQCQPMNHSGGGGSFFTPLLTGFVIGQMMNGGGYRGGGPLYRDRDGRFQNGYGGYLGRDARTGRAMANGRDYGDIARQAPSRVQSRTTVVSRGGFGGGGRSFGG
ncbi:hypothetical protein BH10PSE2_BH10PSE2_00830 [soil metagenome]